MRKKIYLSGYIYPTSKCSTSRRKTKSKNKNPKKESLFSRMRMPRFLKFRSPSRYHKRIKRIKK